MMRAVVSSVTLSALLSWSASCGPVASLPDVSDSVSLDTVTTDTVPPDTVTTDTVTSDTEVADTEPADTETTDTVTTDAVTTDTELSDTETADVVTADTTELDTVAADTTPPDPCEVSPCAAPEASRCANDRASQINPQPATCEAVEGMAVCTYPADEVQSCGAGGVCLLGACQTVGTVCEFPYTTNVTRLTLMVPGGQSNVTDPVTGDPDDQCCFDLDDDGAIDNGLGATFKGLEPFVGPIADVQAAALQRGPPILDFFGLDDLDNDPEVDLIYYHGVSPDAAGDVNLNPVAFAAGSAIPPGVFAGRVEDGVFYAEDGYFQHQVGSPLHEFSIEIEHARIELALDAALDGAPGLTTGGAPGQVAGRLGGVMQRDGWLAWFNSYANDFCTCTVFNGPSADEPVIDMASGTCVPPLSGCPDGQAEGDSLCGILVGQYCPLFLSFFGNDIDTDGDGTDDRISVGYWLTGVPTTILGVRGCD